MGELTLLDTNGILRQPWVNRVGVAPHQYLLHLRVDEARRMLASGRLPVADVATRCGFSHQEHLTRVLRTRLGTTPAAIRRARRSD